MSVEREKADLKAGEQCKKLDMAISKLFNSFDCYSEAHMFSIQISVFSLCSNPLLLPSSLSESLTGNWPQSPAVRPS